MLEGAVYTNRLPNSSLGASKIELADMGKLKDSSVVLWLDNLEDNKLFDWYSSIRVLIKHNNKVVLVLDKNNRSNIRKQVCMLLASMGCYNIYEMASEDLDEECLSNMLGREASELEVEEYIGCDILAYDKASEIILSIKELVDKDNTDGLLDYLEDNKEVIRNIPVVLDFLKKYMDSSIRGVDVRLEKMKKSLDDALVDAKSAQEKYKDAVIKLKSLEEERDSLSVKSSTLEKDVSSLNSQKKSLEKRIEDLEASNSMDDFGDMSVTKYRAIDTAQFRTLNKYIVYFKEMSHVTYAKSMVEYLAAYLRMMGRKVVFAIYDRRNDFIGAMKGCTIVNGEILSKNPGVIANAREDAPILVTDTNMSVLNALLKSDAEVLIIFDRLRCRENLVTGTMVTKFNIVGDRNQLEGLTASTGESFPHNKTILEKAYDDYLYIPRIENFGRNRTSDISSYASAKISGKATLFDSILDACGIPYLD